MTRRQQVHARAGIVIGAIVCAMGMIGCGQSGVDGGDSAAMTQQEEGMAVIADGMVVQITYTLTVDGQVVDASEEGQPLSYVHGQGQLIPGLERALAGLHAGDARAVTVAPDDGYGAVNPEAFVEVERSRMPDGLDMQVGAMLEGRDPEGRPFRAIVSAFDETNVTLDMNHPLAGKTLNFNVEVVGVAPAS